MIIPGFVGRLIVTFLRVHLGNWAMYACCGRSRVALETHCFQVKIERERRKSEKGREGEKARYREWRERQKEGERQERVTERKRERG